MGKVVQRTENLHVNNHRIDPYSCLLSNVQRFARLGLGFSLSTACGRLGNDMLGLVGPGGRVG